MSFQPDAPPRPEVVKCRWRVMAFCCGLGLDLGCGREKVHPLAVGVDFLPEAADLLWDIRQGLPYADQAFDFVFSSHLLQDLPAPEAALAEWFRVLRPGGYLVLYLPHAAFAPRLGEPGCPPAQKHDFLPEDLLALARRVGGLRLVQASEHDEDDEFSFQLVFQKQ
ncbi:MAG: class I SAM-dependent methyltransferase [Deltaproteobacteria bacterium]|nr:class I SAM-dependent methyltransferase [Deltaproteobacteria bacterium]